MVIEGDSCSRGHEFEFRDWIELFLSCILNMIVFIAKAENRLRMANRKPHCNDIVCPTITFA